MKNNWAIGGSSGKVYSDNSAALHEYILKQYPTIDLYWIINKESGDIKNLNNISGSRILYRNSVKANIFVLLAKVHIVSHGKKDLSSYNGEFFKKTLKVYLGHGIQGLKKIKMNLNRLKTINKDYDLVVANSQFEKNIKKNWGIDEKKIIITGLPRFDKLKLKASQNRKQIKRKILYMPTWRDWLTNEVNIKDTKYYRIIYDFLNNEYLNEQLKSKGVILSFYPHINMEKHFLNTQSNNSNIKILSNDISLQNEIISSELLITDYSSICWDFLYINKPVIFFQFDIKEYLESRGSYLNLYKDLFGPVAYKSQEAVSYLVEHLSGSELSKNVPELKECMFQFDDLNNCNRIMQVILEKIDEN